MAAEFDARLMLAGKVAEFVGGPADGDRCELPGWALMHDGAIAMPEQTVASFNPNLDLSELRVAVYRPDWVPPMLSNGVGTAIQLTPDLQALRYVFVSPEDASHEG